jgi:ATP-dependent DNA helicase RecG
LNGKRLIFISSVQAEFADARRALRDFIHGDRLLGRFFEVFLFEDLPAADRRADDVYLGQVDGSELFIAVMGDRYGSEDSEGVSPTEREFNRATDQGKERLVFVRGHEDAHRDPKMLALIRRASAQVIRRRFDSALELTALVYASLVEHLSATGVLRTKPFDAAACPEATLEDLSDELVTDFLRRAGAARQFGLSAETPMEDALTHLNLLDKTHPSHAAVLLFGRKPQRFLPASEVKCLHFHGTTVQKPIPSYQIYKGTVFELVDQAVDFVMSKIGRTVGTRFESAQAPVTYELPREAVAEAIVNAVAHRDYASNASVQVMLFADRLEVWNPGQLPPSLTPELLRRPHASIPRNPLLAEPLFLARYIEKAGTGTLDMIALSEAAGLQPPAFRQEGGQFTQTLYRPREAGSAQVGDGKAALDKASWNRVLEEIAVAYPAATAQVTAQVAAQVAILCREPRSSSEIREHLGLRHWKTFHANYLAPMLDGGILERTIPDKPTSSLQQYRLTKSASAWMAGILGQGR